MQTQPLDGGFKNAPIDAAHAFRAALDVLARPGKITDISGAMPPAPLSIAAGTLALTLCDPETPIWLAPSLQTDALVAWLKFHTGAPLVDRRSDAMFAIGGWKELLPITDFAIGTAQYPDRSATLIVEMQTLLNSGATLRGPGIKTTAELSLPDIKPFQDNATLFPLGLDFYFTAGSRIAALPRSTKIGDQPCM